MTPEEYLTNPAPTCPRCREPKPDVRARLNHLLEACGLDEGQAIEPLCGDCAHELWLES